MTYPHRPGSGAANPVAQVSNTRWTAKKTPVAQRSEWPTRRYEAMALMPGGDLVEVTRSAPAHPLYESAFAAIARGTIMATRDGPVAVEDLLPGIEVETRDDGFQPLLWIGAITLTPPGAQRTAPARLFRIPSDSFGPARPMPDLVLAPHARLLHRSPRLSEIADDSAVLTEVPAFEDGFNVIRVAPVSSVKVYHLAFREHHILRANGLEIESFHPGPEPAARLTGDSLRLFLSLFPHVTGLSDFGSLRAPRLSPEEFRTLTAA